MGDEHNAQTPGKRPIVEILDREFARLHARSCLLLEKTSDQILYLSPSTEGKDRVASVGEAVLRSAAAIERTFGGITANLWDDPFEWTLPEQLTTSASVLAYLSEVEILRQRAFESFTDDECLLKQVATPADETRSLIELLLETLVRAGSQQSQAGLTLRILSGIITPGFII